MGDIAQDDNTVITTLETLKREASEVSKKADETDQIMADVEKTSRKYLPLSQACRLGTHHSHFL